MTGGRLFGAFVADAKRSPFGAGLFGVACLFAAVFTAYVFGLFDREPSPHATMRILHMWVPANASGAPGTEIHFQMAGYKLDASAPPIVSASYIMSDLSAMPVSVRRFDGLGLEDLPARTPGERYVSSEFIIDRIPEVARTDPGARVRICLVYQSPPQLACDDKMFRDVPETIPATETIP